MFRIDFTLCNPPFYKNNEEIEALKDNKVKAPNSVWNYTNHNRAILTFN
jgi:23S rRNA A1618 N6-methylase RlmF